MKPIDLTLIKSARALVTAFTGESGGEDAPDTPRDLEEESAADAYTAALVKAGRNADANDTAKIICSRALARLENHLAEWKALAGNAPEGPHGSDHEQQRRTG
jgi:hypothetical protein